MEHQSDVTIVSTQGMKTSDSGVGLSSLVMIHGEFLGRRYKLEQEILTIGRSPDCGITLSDDSVSRRHCKLNPSTSNVILLDSGSTNGTYVNDTLVSARPLRDGDKIQIGRTIFKFLSGDNIEHQYHEEIYRLKTTDGLTGTNNKRTFDEEIKREFYRYCRYRRPVCLLMIDIDFFKRVNDSWGHLAGDRVLGELASIIGKMTCREESLSRYGGEEFALLLPETPIEQAAVRAEEIRVQIENRGFHFDGEEIPITVSIGVAEAQHSMDTEDAFIAAADRRLYMAKKNGRNCVVFSG